MDDAVDTALTRDGTCEAEAVAVNEESQVDDGTKPREETLGDTITAVDEGIAV